MRYVISGMMALLASSLPFRKISNSHNRVGIELAVVAVDEVTKVASATLWHLLTAMETSAAAIVVNFPIAGQ